MRIPEAWIVGVGDALVTGRRNDTAGTRVARWLEALGCEIRGRILVPGKAARIGEAVRVAAAAGVDVVAIVGGIGLGADRATREGVAEALGRPLESDPVALAAIERRHRERGREVPEKARSQSLRPAGSELLANPVGTAPGFLVDLGRTLVVVLPGAARELEEAFERNVRPRLRPRLEGAIPVRATELHVAGLPEAEVERRVEACGGSSDLVRTSMATEHGEVSIYVTARGDTAEEADQLLERTVAAIELPLGDHVFGRDDESLVGVLRDQLARRGWTLAVAESITGGLLAKRITDLPGAGSFFAGALVPYADRRKAALLGCPDDLLERCGPVSAEAARAMAESVRSRIGADVALAATGIAGPAGGTTDKPVGLSYIAIAWPDRTIVRRHLFTGDRLAIRHHVATAALDQARRALAGLAPLGDPPEDPEGGA